MNAYPKNRALIIGIGNADRGDDQAGLVVARLIRARALSLWVVEELGEGTALIDLWRSTAGRGVYLIDTIASGQMPGHVQRFDVGCEPLSTTLGGGSSHLFGAAQAIELSRALGELPPRFIVYGIEGKSFNFGAALSPEVEAGARIAAERIIAECLRGQDQ